MHDVLPRTRESLRRVHKQIGADHAERFARR